MAATRGRVKAISISKEKGTPKVNVQKARLQVSLGIVGDAHAPNWNRQISLLGVECMDKMDKEGLNISPGDFPENITTEGINLEDLTIGSKLKFGATVELEITKSGETCHGPCQNLEVVHGQESKLNRQRPGKKRRDRSGKIAARCSKGRPTYHRPKVRLR